MRSCKQIIIGIASVAAMGAAIGWLLMAAWTREDAIEVCSAMGYTSTEIEYGWQPVGVCVLSLPGVTVRHKVSDVYRKYVRDMRRKYQYKRGV